PDRACIQKAKDWISDLTELPEVNKVYQGTVTKILDFGAFVEFIPGTEGLLHVSELSWEHVKDVNSVVKEGQKLEVKLVDIDERTGKFRLSLKALQEKPEGWTPPPPRENRGRQGGNDRRPRRDNARS
ncbi:MAG: S1 RNA-binding domain-containing protein, partial [Planctomycetes bacterium]|nr:S1 RNA-binding domain-containing protein [Planctomycetota bacterium]